MPLFLFHIDIFLMGRYNPCDEETPKLLPHIYRTMVRCMPGKKKNHEKNLTAQQEAAINLLATGSTLEEVAEALNISITQLYRWRKGNPAFLAKLKELKVDLNLKI